MIASPIKDTSPTLIPSYMSPTLTTYSNEDCINIGKHTYISIRMHIYRQVYIYIGRIAYILTRLHIFRQRNKVKKYVNISLWRREAY